MCLLPFDRYCNVVHSPRALVFSGADKRECYLGEEAVAKRGVLTLSYPACISAMNPEIDPVFLSVLDSSLLPTVRQLTVHEVFFGNMTFDAPTHTHTYNDLSESACVQRVCQSVGLGHPFGTRFLMILRAVNTMSIDKAFECHELITSREIPTCFGKCSARNDSCKPDQDRTWCREGLVGNGEGKCMKLLICLDSLDSSLFRFGIIPSSMHCV